MKSCPRCRPALWPAVLGLFLTSAAVPAQEVPRTTERPESASGDPNGRKDQGGEDAEQPGPLEPLFRATDPARFQREFDRVLGLDTGEQSERPRGPEIPEPVFFDNVRPLGDLKYSNELNYLVNPSTRNAPTLQVIEYEYTFADWRAAELDLSYFNGNLQILTAFYQRTLGVARNRNWIHGYQLSADVYLRSGFVGGSPVYMFAWKPREESRFSSQFFVGANRALIGGFNPASSVRSAFAAAPLPPSGSGDREHPFGAWRPTFNVNLFYKVRDRWTVGVETDLFFGGGKAGEYLSFPFLTYEAGKHAFFQVGAGYYRFESLDQLTVFAHVNLVNPTTRRPRDRQERREKSGGEEPAGGSRIRRFLGRWLGDH